MRTESVGWRRGLPALAGAACVAALAVVVLLATSAGGSNGGYTVRAIFDDAGNIISGEDVKIDGVKVGTVGSVTPTPQAKAAVVLNIENPGFQDFRSDASCTIRPQALIGEKYVDCLPTQPRVEGTPLPPPLQKIASGHEGAGEYLLPVQNTHSPVDVDLLGDISRLPERQRLTIILNELGAGLAGRGSDLSEVIQPRQPGAAGTRPGARDPRQREPRAGQTRRRLRPGAGAVRARARPRRRLHRAEQQGRAGERRAPRRARAEPRTTSRRSCEQLGPAMERLGRFAEQTTPVFTDLGSRRARDQQGVHAACPASPTARRRSSRTSARPRRSSGPALVGDAAAARRLEDARQRRQAVLGQLLRTARAACANTGGLERLLDFIFLGAGTANGYDALGHFLRAEGVGTACLSYAVALSGAAAARKLVQHRHRASAGKAATASRRRQQRRAS